MEEADVSCADWIPVLRPHLSETLVDPESLELLRDLWQRFRGEPLVAVEVRLKEKARRVDSAFRLASPGDARRVAAGDLPQHLRRLLDRWGREPGLGHPKPVSALWLEYDLDGEPGSPIVCAQIQGRTDPDWLVDLLFPALSGRSLTLSQRAAVLGAVAALPPGVHLLYAFSLHPRLEKAVRIELFGLELPALVSSLEHAASPALAAQLAPLEPLLQGADRYHLSFDVADQVLPRVGIECGWRRLPHREPGWRRTLDRWVTAGLATARKRDALLDWPGYDSLWSAPSLWPERAIDCGDYLVRCLSHLKVVSTPRCDPEAKAYLLFQRYRRQRRIDEPES